MNLDPEVMEYFPKPLSDQESAGLLHRLRQHYDLYGYTYFAVELIEPGEFIGFIGMARQDYPAVFNPSTDIGWRVKKSVWGKGLGSEGAQKCLALAFSQWQLERVVAVCVLRNAGSERVMQKIGREKRGEFDHPRLEDYPDIARCCWYEIRKEEYPDAVSSRR